MNIHQLAKQLNIMAREEDYQIATLPELRKKYLGKQKLPAKIFTSHTIQKKYAFHYGGRDELQFNFGEETIDGRLFTRFVLAISLKSSPSLKRPLETLKPYMVLFNDCFLRKSEYFEGFKMWIYHKGKRSVNLKPQMIPNEWFIKGNFIALGNLIEKPINELTEKDLRLILKGFDNLLPIYKYCVLDSQNSSKQIENRIAKVTWNKLGWLYPSGPEGKSPDVKAHENDKGYGHEEWLFDIEKEVGGYHYGLLQPAQRGRSTYLNKLFNVRLYSHNSIEKKNLWIGEIRNLEVISNEEAETAYKIYKERGWIGEMTKQLKDVNANVKHFLQLEPQHCFNVKFKPSDARLYEPQREVKDFDSTIGTYHYSFVKDKVEKKTEELTDKKPAEKRIFIFKPGKSEKSLSKKVSRRTAKTVESKPVHNTIQEILYSYLAGKHGENFVSMEANTGMGTFIDLVVQVKDGLILYEVKSYVSVMNSIRVALGQLVEYAFYPEAIKQLKELIIVSHISPDESDIEYLKSIRENSSLKVYYQVVDISSRMVSKKW